MPKHLILRLEAPLMSFGGETIDANGVVRDFPARSMIAGLLGNALGYERNEGDRLERFQERLVCGAVRVRDGTRIRDYQTARLAAKDRGWTTRGAPEGRNRSSSSFKPDQEQERRTGIVERAQTHERLRDADADALILVALRLEPANDAPTLDAIATALDRPERPLFIGRKPFLPSRPLFLKSVEAKDVLAALRVALDDIPDDVPDADEARVRAQWPEGEGERDGSVIVAIADERDWIVGVHTGQRRVVEGWLSVSQ